MPPTKKQPSIVIHANAMPPLSLTKLHTDLFLTIPVKKHEQ
jgi:hypothetical protein